MNGLRERKKVAWHLNDLLDRPATIIAETIANLDVSERDKRRNPRAITVARFTAAQIYADAWSAKNAALYNLVLERTEGKVPDVRVNLQGEDIVARLEAARARLALPASDAHIIDRPAIAGEVVPRETTIVECAPVADIQEIPLPSDAALISTTAVVSQTVDTGHVDVPTPAVKPVTLRVSRLTSRVKEPAGGDPGTIEGGGGSGEPTPSDTATPDAVLAWMRTPKKSAKSRNNK